MYDMYYWNHIYHLNIQRVWWSVTKHQWSHLGFSLQRKQQQWNRWPEVPSDFLAGSLRTWDMGLLCTDLVLGGFKALSMSWTTTWWSWWGKKSCEVVAILKGGQDATRARKSPENKCVGCLHGSCHDLGKYHFQFTLTTPTWQPPPDMSWWGSLEVK